MTMCLFYQAANSFFIDFHVLQIRDNRPDVPDVRKRTSTLLFILQRFEWNAFKAPTIFHFPFDCNVSILLLYRIHSNSYMN